MIIGTVVQQPGDTLDYDILYEPFFYSYAINGVIDDIKLDGLSITVSPEGVTSEVIRLDNNNAKVWLSGGVSGVTYKVTITMESTNNRIKEDEILMIVEEF